MDIPEEQVKIMKVLGGVSPRLGMKAGRIANELYGPPPGSQRIWNGQKISGAIAELRKNGFIEDVKDSVPGKAGSWVLTNKGRNLLEEMED